MLNYTAYGEDEITTEVDRYLTWPGQACAYKIGELQIRKLRRKAKDELGTYHSVCRFFKRTYYENSNGDKSCLSFYMHTAY